MKVKIVNPEHAAALLDPQTLRSPFDADGYAEVPETNFWMRRVMSGEVTRVDAAPRGNEPVTPLTTRRG